MASPVIVPGRYVFTGQGGGPVSARGGAYDDGARALLLGLLPAAPATATRLAVPPPPPFFTVGQLTAATAPGSTLTAAASPLGSVTAATDSGQLTAATAAASTLTAGTQATGGPG